MRVCHYFEFENHITGGIATSVKHQRKMLDLEDIDYTTSPDLDVDLVHLNVMGPRSVLLAKRARRRGIPVVVHTHMTAEEWEGGSFRLTDWVSGPFRHYLSYAYGLADHLICPSDYNRGLIEAYSDAPKTVMSNGVDVEKLEGFERFRGEYLERYSLSPPTVFCVGHVLKRKGLEAFVDTAETMPDTDFAWFGYVLRNLKTRETTSLIDDAPENCHFTGYVEDIRGAYGAGDIFFFPTHEENQGIALLEAMVCKKAIVIRDIPIYDWLEHETHCLKADSVDGFTEQIKRLKSDAELRERLGENASELAEEHHLEQVAPKLRSIYKQMRDA